MPAQSVPASPLQVSLSGLLSGSSVLIIGWKLQKLYPESLYLVPTNAAGSGSPVGPQKSLGKSEASLFAFLQTGVLKIPHG